MKRDSGRGASHALGGSLCFIWCGTRKGVSEDTSRGTGTHKEARDRERSIQLGP
jgi:hypothetical protein